MKKTILKKSFATMMISSMLLGVVLMPLNALAEESTDTENVGEEIIMIENEGVNLEETIIIENEEMNLEEITIIDNADENIENTELAIFSYYDEIMDNLDLYIRDLINGLEEKKSSTLRQQWITHKPIDIEDRIQHWIDYGQPILVDSTLTREYRQAFVDAYRDLNFAIVRIQNLNGLINHLALEEEFGVTDSAYYTADSWARYQESLDICKTVALNIFDYTEQERETTYNNAYSALLALVPVSTQQVTPTTPVQDTQGSQNQQDTQNTQDTKPVFTGKTNTPAPQTGDTSATIMYGVMLALSAITSIVLIARKYKKI